MSDIERIDYDAELRIRNFAQINLVEFSKMKIEDWTDRYMDIFREIFSDEEHADLIGGAAVGDKEALSQLMKLLDQKLEEKDRRIAA